MALTASQTRNLNPDEQAGGMSSPGTLLTQGGPGFVGGGMTQSTPYSPGGGEATRSGMFTNIQDYLKANEGAAAPIVSKFEEKAQGIATPIGKMAGETKTSLSGLKSNLETAKSGLESSLASQGELKGILSKAQTTPSSLSQAEIGKFRTGVGSYATPDVTSSIQSFVPKKEKAASDVANLISSANRAQSELQPLGEISGVKGLIRQFNPNERITAGGSSLDAFITRQAPEYQQFTQDLGTKISGVKSAKTSVNPLFSDIERYLGTGEGSLANIGSQFDPGYATGSKFQTAAESQISNLGSKSPIDQNIYKSQFQLKDTTSQPVASLKGGAANITPISQDPNLISRGGTSVAAMQDIQGKIAEQIRNDYSLANTLSQEEKNKYIALSRLAGITEDQISSNLNKTLLSTPDIESMAEDLSRKYKSGIYGPASPTQTPSAVSPEIGLAGLYALATASNAPSISQYGIDRVGMTAPGAVVSNFASNLGSFFKG